MIVFMLLARLQVVCADVKVVGVQDVFVFVLSVNSFGGSIPGRR